MSISLTDHQWDAVKVTADWYKTASQQYGDMFQLLTPENPFGTQTAQQTFVFAGYAGSGKSTCVGTMIEHIGLTEESVMYMAPTGKAAKVLSKKLRADGWSRDATTIHKAIYMPRAMEADRIKQEMERMERQILFDASSGEAGEPHPDAQWHGVNKRSLERRLLELENALRDAMDADSPSFYLKSADELPPEIKLFVVDEASMVGNEVARDLETFGIPVLAIGDPGQLPPVGDDWGFNMDNPDVFLTEIHRQAAENPIIHLATLARRGELLKPQILSEDVRVVKRQDDDVTLNMDREAMVLVGTHKKRWLLTKKIRDKLGHFETGPMSGEPILVGKNSKKYPSLVNGSLLINKTDWGDLRSGNTSINLDLIDPEADNLAYNLWAAQCFFEEHQFRKRNSYSGAPKEVFAAKVRNEQLDWGHVLTVHKSQGSEWDDVVVHDESGVFRDQGPRWLYTGITRAAEKLTVVI